MPLVSQQNPYDRVDSFGPKPCNCVTDRAPHNQSHVKGGLCGHCGHDSDHCFCKPVELPPFPDAYPAKDSTNTVTSDGVAKALSDEHKLWTDVTGDPADFHGQPIGTLMSEINLLYDMLVTGVGAASDFAKIKGAPIVIDNTKLVLAADTRDYVVQVDSAPVAGVYADNLTTYTFTTPSPAAVTVTNQGKLQYQWFRATGEAHVTISSDPNNALVEHADGLYVSSVINTGLPVAPAQAGSYALVVDAAGNASWVPANILAVQP